MPSSPIPGVEFVLVSWNYDLVNDLFPLSEAALILATPLSWRLPHDKLIWHYDVKCAFSVKNVTRLLLLVILRHLLGIQLQGECRFGKLCGRLMFWVKFRCVFGGGVGTFCPLMII